MTLADAHFVFGRSRASAVVLAGPVGSGKTTLAIATYEAFRRAKFSRHSFVGSHTLVGWEERCHDSRVRSDRAAPATQRTPEDPSNLLHLEVYERDTGWTRDILLTDISGEAFRRIRDNSSEADLYPVLRRTDHLVLTVDGARLADPAERHAAVSEIVILQRSLLEWGQLPGAFLMHVITKWDTVVEAGNEAEGFAKSALGTLADAARAHGHEPYQSVTAARSVSERVDRLLGVEDLLARWIQVPSWLPTVRMGASTTMGAPSRFMDRYGALP